MREKSLYRVPTIESRLVGRVAIALVKSSLIGD